MIHPLGARASVYDSRLPFFFFLSWTLTPLVPRREGNQEAKRRGNFDLRSFGMGGQDSNEELFESAQFVELFK